VRDLAELAQRLFDFCPRVGDPFVAVPLVGGFVGQSEVDRGRDQALLCAVVEVALEFPALSLGCAREPGVRIGELAERPLPGGSELRVLLGEKRGCARSL
jgi:hypothetical protein